jgi:hypothetical protein
VIWPFDGFFPPLYSLPAVNFAKAGSAIPIKFALGGDRGLDILAAGSPASAPSDCSANHAIGVRQVPAPGASGLSYDPNTSQYSFVWKTAKTWAGTCRVLTITLRDGTSHNAFFNFAQ